jgi:hypothetical protein
MNTGRNRFVALALLASALLGPGGTPAEAKPRQDQQPARRQIKLRTMWSYQEELGLTADQVQQMKDAFMRLQEYLKECQERIGPARNKVREMIEQGEDIEKIKPWLQSIATIQVEMQLADIKASREINATMKPQQLKKWQEIQRKSRTASQPAAGGGGAESSAESGLVEPAGTGTSGTERGR